MMNFDSMTLDELIAAYNSAGKPNHMRNAILDKTIAARKMLARHTRTGILSDKNIADLNANIAKAKATIA